MSRLTWAALIVSVIAVVLAGLLIYAEEFKPARDAEAACRSRVEASLRSPSTADFGDFRVTERDTDFEVFGYVDAQNGFGATVRTDFRCAVEGSVVTAFDFDQRGVDDRR